LPFLFGDVKYKYGLVPEGDGCILSVDAALALLMELDTS
jgi:hypothetical protein